MRCAVHAAHSHACGPAWRPGWVQPPAAGRALLPTRPFSARQLQETIGKTDAKGKLLPEMVCAHGRCGCGRGLLVFDRNNSGQRSTVLTATHCLVGGPKRLLLLSRSHPCCARTCGWLLRAGPPTAPRPAAADPHLPEPAQQPAAPQRVHPGGDAALLVPNPRGGAAGAAGALGCATCGRRWRAWQQAAGCAAISMQRQQQGQVEEGWMEERQACKGAAPAGVQCNAPLGWRRCVAC